MRDADELLVENDLAGARAALVARLKAVPDDQPARMFLFQLLCVCGEWDKADTHLQSLGKLSPEAQLLTIVYGQLIAAERTRQAAFAGDGKIPVLVEGAAWVNEVAGALEAFARSDAAAGDALRDSAFSAAPDTPGTIDGVPFQWICDADPRFGPCMEAVIGGRWGLIPFEAIASLTSQGPRDLRDLVWQPVELTLRSGQSATGFLCVLYPGTAAQPDGGLRLGRSTQWASGPGGDHGLGQRVWTTDEGAAIGLQSLRQLVMT